MWGSHLIVVGGVGKKKETDINGRGQFVPGNEVALPQKYEGCIGLGSFFPSFLSLFPRACRWDTTTHREGEREWVLVSLRFSSQLNGWRGKRGFLED